MIQNFFNELQFLNQKVRENNPYNIFNVLSLNDKENELHTNLLRDLLNPNGQHGLGTYFLKIFTSLLNKTILTKIDIENATSINVTSNKYIGIINNDFTLGGYLDIEIQIDSTKVIIENKIYAQDQKNQLLRYNNYGQNRSVLLYQTLDGRQAPMESTAGSLTVNKDYFPISYRTFIAEWLTVSMTRIPNNKITLHSTLSMYLNTIKMITDNKIQNHITDIRQKLIEKKETFLMLPDVVKAYNSIKEDIESAFYSKLQEKYGHEKIVKTLPGYDIYSSYGTQRQLFYLSFYIKKDGNKVNRNTAGQLFDNISDQFKSISTDFSSDNWDVAYKKIECLNGLKISDQSNDMLFELTQEENIDKLVQSVIDEMRFYTNAYNSLPPIRD